MVGRLAEKEPHPDRPARVRNVRHILDAELPDNRSLAHGPAGDRRGPPPRARTRVRRRGRALLRGRGWAARCRDWGEPSLLRRGPSCRWWRRRCGAPRARIAEGRHPLACIRLSGHHAQRAQADGFCFFNNVAVAAEDALSTAPVDRVAIVDWDVHHGNGTQEVFYDRDDVLFISLHNDHGSWDPDAHPQTGNVDEDGAGEGAGYNVNVPLPPGTGDEGYQIAFDRLVSPIVSAFDPDLLLVSAGQDPGTVDPLGRNVVTKSGFAALGAGVRDLASVYADGRLALVQEGGYQQSHLAYATLGIVEGVLDIDAGVEDPFDWLDEDVTSTRRALDEVVEYYRRYWEL